MTDREKAIITAYTGINMLEGERFNEFYKYLEELYGRPVYTHEIPFLDVKEKSEDDFFKLCREKPTISPRKGKWIPVDSYSAFGGDEATWVAHGNPVAFYYCSECKEQTYAGEDGESLITDYCPNCGCRMEEGDSDE